MMTLYCDESDDGETYALAGWLAVPTAWEHFDPAWRAMLDDIRMPDGSPCRAFHAVDIVEREKVKASPFKGWTFQDEINAFDKAISIIEDDSVVANLWPVGVALELPRSFVWIPRDAIWLMLFTKLFFLLAEMYPQQRSIAFMFDEKKEISKNAVTIYNTAKAVTEREIQEEYLSTIIFGDDKNFPPLQAADLLAYEWRKRISDETHRPDKAARRSWTRLRQSRNQGALWRYGRSMFDEAMQIDPVTGDQTTAYYNWFYDRPPTHLD